MIYGDVIVLELDSGWCGYCEGGPDNGTLFSGDLQVVLYLLICFMKEFSVFFYKNNLENILFLYFNKFFQSSSEDL